MDQVVNLSSNLINATIGTAAWTLKPILKIIEKGTSDSQNIVLKETIYSLPPDMRKWIAIAGLMGASAVAIGAYGVSFTVRVVFSNFSLINLTYLALIHIRAGSCCVSQKGDTGQQESGFRDSQQISFSPQSSVIECTLR